MGISAKGRHLAGTTSLAKMEIEAGELGVYKTLVRAASHLAVMVSKCVRLSEDQPFLASVSLSRDCCLADLLMQVPRPSQ